MALWLCTRTNKLPKFLHRRTAIVVSLIVGVLVYLEMRVKEGEKVDTREDVSEVVLGDKKLPGCIIIGKSSLNCILLLHSFI